MLMRADKVVKDIRQSLEKANIFLMFKYIIIIMGTIY